MWITIFWAILSISFFILAILSWHASREPLDQLEEMTRREGGIYYRMSKHGNVKLTEPIYKLLRGMVWTNIIAFILAGFAAVLSWTK